MAVVETVRWRRPHIVADVLSDHVPDERPNRLVRCSCNGGQGLYDWPDWRLHVGHAVATALDEDAAHVAEHGCASEIPSSPAWCLCGVVDDRGDGTCGNCGRRIMTDDDEPTLPPEPQAPEPEYVDCTCGHPNADHTELGECPFPGCGCGALADAPAEGGGRS
ncbi:hypothetical protein [Nocardioides aquiterrae]|uniref:Uncharacterized protein n=1 Tax=Nocardioides aquiterrae TaxID=203799 RepID=A0ABP4F051_9ACTN